MLSYHGTFFLPRRKVFGLRVRPADLSTEYTNADLTGAHRMKTSISRDAVGCKAHHNATWRWYCAYFAIVKKYIRVDF